MSFIQFDIDIELKIQGKVVLLSSNKMIQNVAFD
jgi:hypothetical protein